MIQTASVTAIASGANAEPPSAPITLTTRNLSTSKPTAPSSAPCHSACVGSWRMAEDPVDRVEQDRARQPAPAATPSTHSSGSPSAVSSRSDQVEDVARSSRGSCRRYPTEMIRNRPIGGERTEVDRLADHEDRFSGLGSSNAVSIASRSPDTQPRPAYSSVMKPMIPAVAELSSICCRLIVPGSPGVADDAGEQLLDRRDRDARAHRETSR